MPGRFHNKRGRPVRARCGRAGGADDHPMHRVTHRSVQRKRPDELAGMRHLPADEAVELVRWWLRYPGVKRVSVSHGWLPASEEPSAAFGLLFPSEEVRDRALEVACEWARELFGVSLEPDLDTLRNTPLPPPITPEAWANLLRYAIRAQLSPNAYSLEEIRKHLVTTNRKHSVTKPKKRRHHVVPDDYTGPRAMPNPLLDPWDTLDLTASSERCPFPAIFIPRHEATTRPGVIPCMSHRCPSCMEYVATYWVMVLAGAIRQAEGIWAAELPAILRTRKYVNQAARRRGAHTALIQRLDTPIMLVLATLDIRPRVAAHRKHSVTDAPEPAPRRAPSPVEEVTV